jgi:hypothetical protein
MRDPRIKKENVGSYCSHFIIISIHQQMKMHKGWLFPTGPFKNFTNFTITINEEFCVHCSLYEFDFYKTNSLHFNRSLHVKNKKKNSYGHINFWNIFASSFINKGQSCWKQERNLELNKNFNFCHISSNEHNKVQINTFFMSWPSQS